MVLHGGMGMPPYVSTEISPGASIPRLTTFADCAAMGMPPYVVLLTIAAARECPQPLTTRRHVEGPVRRVFYGYAAAARRGLLSSAAALSTSFNTRGRFMAMSNSDLAAPEGLRRPCSQS